MNVERGWIRSVVDGAGAVWTIHVRERNGRMIRDVGRCPFFGRSVPAAERQEHP